jgi:hypothetical protein
MSPKSTLTDEPYRARVPADLDAPDKVLYGLTFRQLAILAVAAVIFYGGWRSLHTLLPVPVLLGATVVLGGLAVGRRDGLPMDQWLLASIPHQRAPKALSTTDTTSRTPAWVDATAGRMSLPVPLKLPVLRLTGILGLAIAALPQRGAIHLDRTTPEMIRSPHHGATSDQRE